jgi:hypothetical protein
MSEFVEREFGFVEALKVADRAFEKYKEDHLNWWKRMDGTPILHDIAVRMADAFLTEFRCQFLCGVHAELDKNGHLEAFDNCLACIRNENVELRDYKSKLPADWFEDSSLETWFPLTAEELKRAKQERDELRKLNSREGKGE